MESRKGPVWSRVQPRGGTQIPELIRSFLSLQPGDVLFWQFDLDGRVRVSKGTLKEVVQEWPHKANQ